MKREWMMHTNMRVMIILIISQQKTTTETKHFDSRLGILFIIPQQLAPTALIAHRSGSIRPKLLHLYWN